MAGRAWAVRPNPHHRWRLDKFLEHGMAAIGWPGLGCLLRKSRGEIREKLHPTYGIEGRKLGNATGQVDRFVNQIKVGDIVVVPSGGEAYFGEVTREYHFDPQLQPDEEGYPHWIGVEYLKEPIARRLLPEKLFRSLKARMTVFGLDAELAQEVMKKPENFRGFRKASERIPEETKREYAERLEKGTLPGLNQNSLERVVCQVFKQYYSGAWIPPKKSSKPGDTDIIAPLPTRSSVRIQVKYYQGTAGTWAVEQLEKQMEEGDECIVVSTCRLSDEARKLAESLGIDVIEGSDLADLIFENIDSLDEEDLWSAGFSQNFELR